MGQNKPRSNQRRPGRTLGRLALALILCGAVAVPLARWRVELAAQGKVVASAASVEPQDVALVLGTAPTVAGRPNVFYEERLRTVRELWRLGKVRAVLISGDNAHADYSEPDRMKADLVATGIPAAYIVCDYAGFRTFDSIVRAQRVFGLGQVLVVSQRAHVDRALYIAQGVGLQARGLAAADATRWWQARQQLREALARVQAVLDVHLGREPHFLGPREVITLAPVAASR